MIKYRLKCGEGHEFEAWFASSTAYETQEAEGRLACPHCANTAIERAIMAPRVATRRGHEERAAAPAPGAGDQGHQSTAASLHPGQADGAKLRAMLQEIRSVRDKILEKSEYVGPRFAEEARKIHHEESADRAIHGEATPQEVRELADDGIDVLPIPRLPDDLN